MRIAVANTQAPFISGGAEIHAQNLIAALREAGHEAELVTIPFNPSTAELIIDQAIAAASFDINSFFENRVDLMIGLRFPAYLMRHDNKVMWLIHQYREAYDLWRAGGLYPQPEGDRARRFVTQIDTHTIVKAKKIFANSKNVARRLKRFNGLQAEALYHPPPIGELHRGGEYGDFFFYPSRLSGLKRQLLCLEAASCCSQPVRIVFAGAPDNEAVAKAFQNKIEELHLANRVEWRGFVSDTQKESLYRNALAVLFTPQDEDYGYVTLEAMAAGKAVVTTSDSGGPMEFVQQSKTGLIAEPNPQDLARSLDRLWQDRDFAAKLGGAARDHYAGLGLSWQNVVTHLTED